MDPYRRGSCGAVGNLEGVALSARGVCCDGMSQVEVQGLRRGLRDFDGRM
jgi:hypothetical protein